MIINFGVKSKWSFITFFVFIFIHHNDRKLADACSETIGTSADLVTIVDKSSQKTSEKNLSSVESVEITLPNHLKHFEGQLAGHGIHFKNGRGKLALGMLQDDDENILKPYPTKYEINFYETVQKAEVDDSILQELKKYIPAFYGMVNTLIGGTIVPFIKLENFLKGYDKVCTMDVKLGRRRIPPGAPPRTKEQERRYLATMKKWSIGIPGFTYYELDKKAPVHEGKEHGYVLKPKEAIEDLYNFVNKEIGIQCGVVASILTQLRQIDSWFEKQRRFRFFDSSILLTYDAKNLEIFREEKKSELERGKKIQCQASVPVKVRMIDFGKVIPDTQEGPDENFLSGLRSLIYILENLSDLYFDTLSIDYLPPSIAVLKSEFPDPTAITSSESS